MKFLIYFVALLIATILSTIIKELDIAYYLAVSLVPNDVSQTVLLAGLFSGILTATPYGFAIYFAKKINKNRDEVKEFKKAVADSGMSEFEYAKSITPKKIISYCDSHLNDPIYERITQLDALPGKKVISRPCADALMEGYTDLMNEVQSRTTK